MRLSDLQNKDIINVIDGKKIGIIIDITINEDGTLSSLIVEKTKSLLSRFSSSSELEIKWKQITKIGSDVILVSITDFELTLAFLLGVLSSFIVGIVVIKFLLDYLKKGSFKVFAIYRVILGIIVIALTFIK